MTTLPYRRVTAAQIAAEQRDPTGASGAAASIGVPIHDTGYYPTLPGNPTIYTRAPEVGAQATSIPAQNVPWSAPSSIYRMTTTQSNLDNNSSLEESESRLIARGQAVGALERFVPMPAVRVDQAGNPVRIPSDDQAIRRGQWLPPAVRYPSVNLPQRTLYGRSDPNWRRSYTPPDYNGLWAYQQEAAARRRRHAAQLRYLHARSVCDAPNTAASRARYENMRERPLGSE
jgi:hypothetical protein